MLITFKDISNAKSVLIVGGGATGIEMAGEIKFSHPSKIVTLVHSGSALFESGWNEKLGTSLLSQLEAKNVEVIFNSRVDTKGLKTGPIDSQIFEIGGKSIEADFIYIAYGNAPNSSIVSDLNASFVDSQSRVKVLPSLQLETEPSLFAIGDVNNVEETKLSVHAQAQAPIAVANILSLIQNPNTKLKTYSAAGECSISYI